jgi:hypothetical protein
VWNAWRSSLQLLAGPSTAAQLAITQHTLQVLFQCCWGSGALHVQAMDGSMNLEQALEERLNIINCTPADIKRFILAHPPSSRMVPVSNSLLSAAEGV